MRSVSRVIFLIGSLLFGAQHAYPCSCLPRSPDKKLKESEAVFVGEAIAVSKDFQKRTMAVKFKVERYWKGVTYPEVIVISSLPGGGSCGLPVEVGGKFLIYASRSKQLETSICSSRRIGVAADELKKLGKGKVLKTKP